MKVQIDSELYLTGSYAITGDLNNSIEMEALPEGSPTFYPAYKILSKQQEKVVVVNESVEKTREIRMPIFDEETGEETGEYTIINETYYEVEPVEHKVEYTVYYYELDEVKKAKIQHAIDNPDPIEEDDLKTVLSTIKGDLRVQGSNIDYIALLSGIDL